MTHRLDVLTALRFPAATLVFLHHADGRFGIPNGTFQFRGASVSFFIVLSGFLLYLVYGNRDRPLSTRRFYWRRMVRIYPLHWVVLLISLFLFWDREIRLLSSNANAWLLEYGLQVALLQCWYLNPEMVRYFGVTWTLSVLIFCYAVFPLLLKCSRFLPLVLMAVLAACGALLWTVHRFSEFPMAGSIDPITMVHMCPPFRLAEFIVGMIAAQYFLAGGMGFLNRRRLVSSFVDIGLVAACVLFWIGVVQVVKHEINQPWVTAVVETIPAASPSESSNSFRVSLLRWFLYIGFALPAGLIIVWFARSSGIIARSLSSRVLVFLGNLSFALYLCHRPITLRLEGLMAFWAVAPGVALLLSLCVALIASLVLYLLVERPLVMLMRRRTGRAPRIAKPSSTGPQRTEVGGYGLLAAAILVLFVVQASWPAIQQIEFANQVHVQAYETVNRGGAPMILIGWRAEYPVQGRLIVLFTTKQGVVVKRNRVATFGRGDGNQSSGSKQVWIPLHESKSIAFAKLAFFVKGRRQAVLIQDRDGGQTGYRTIWSANPKLRKTVRMTRGLEVAIDRIELRKNVLAIDLHWKCHEPVDGHLYVRQFDAMDQHVLSRPVNRFSKTDSKRRWVGRRRLSINLNQHPDTESVVLSFRRYPVETLSNGSATHQDERRILLWDRQDQDSPSAF